MNITQIEKISKQEWKNDWYIRDGIKYHKDNNYDEIKEVIKSFYIKQPHDGIYERWAVDKDGKFYSTRTIFNKLGIADYRTKAYIGKNKNPYMFVEHVIRNSENDSVLTIDGTGYYPIDSDMIETIQDVVSKCRTFVDGFLTDDLYHVTVVIDVLNKDESTIHLYDPKGSMILFKDLDKWMLDYTERIDLQRQLIKEVWNL